MSTLPVLVAFALSFWFFDGLFAWVVAIALVIWLAYKGGVS